MAETSVFPPQFADLEHLSAWALETQNERYAKRLDTGLGELKTVHATLTERLPQMLDYLDDKGPPDALQTSDRNLLNLALSAAATGVAVERLGARSIENAMDLLRFQPAGF